MKRTVLKKISRKAGIKRKLSKPGRIIKAKRSRALTKIVSKASGKRKGISKRSEVIKVTKVEKRKPLAKFNPTPRAISEIKIGLASSAAFNSVPQITITKIWSNLLSPVSANYLPKSSGANDYPYIMVGVNNSNVANVGVSVDADATILPKLKASICYWDSSGTNYVFVSGATASFAADGTTNISVSNFPLDDYIYDQKYFVVVWEDDGSGTYNPADDHRDTSSRCQIVFADQAILAHVWGELNTIHAAWSIPYPNAANFLGAFIYGSAPSGITSPVSNMSIGPNYANLDATLHHNTGVAWTSATAGTIPLYIFDNSTALSQKIQADTDFINTIVNTMTSAKAISDVQSHSFTTPDYWFHWNALGPDGLPLTTITFNKSNSADLYYAIRNANVSDYVVWVRVQAGTLNVLQVAVYGNVNCIYSFNFDEPSKHPRPFQWGALLQSGHNTGQVFYYQVSFDNGDISGVPSYTYPPP